MSDLPPKVIYIRPTEIGAVVCTSRHKHAIAYQRLSIPPVDMDELIHQWAEEQGFETWYADHSAVMLNFCRWLTARLGKGETE